MSVMKISGLVNLPANALAIGLVGGATWALPPGQGVVGGFGSIATPQLGTNNPLTGQYIVQLGQYSALQMYDAGLNYWRNVNVGPMSLVGISSDGTNFRLANSTGCPVGALITAAGSAGVNGFYGFNAQRAAITIVGGQTTLGNTVFTITPSAGSSLWNAIVGGAVNATLSFSGTVFNGNYGVNNAFGASTGGVTASAGSNYLAPPMIIFTPPPNQGAQPYVLPQATCTISGGAINAITVTQQGAGLLGLPGITVVPQIGDTTGGGAVVGWLTANTTNVGTGTCVLMWPAFYGTAVTSAPTFTFGGSANPAPSATAIMNFTITSITNTTPGVGYGNNLASVFSGGIVAGSAALNSPGNPIYDKGLSLPVFPPLSVANSTGVTTLAGPFGGVNIQAVPTIVVVLNNTAVQSTVAVQTPVMGGAADVCTLISL
jgi:hypothetical protein